MSTRTFLHFLIKEKYIEASPLLEAKSPKQPTHDLVTISPDLFQKLLFSLKSKAYTGDEKSIRDLAIILLLGIAGLKATEAANLSWADVFYSSEQNSENSQAVGSIIVKGSNERIIPIDSFFCECLRRLRKLREELGLANDTSASLFFGYMNLSRKTRTNFLHRHGIKFVVYEVCNEILAIPFNSESLRNHAISQWISLGYSAEKIAELAGYSSLNSLDKFSLEVRSTRLPRRHIERNSNI